MYLTICEVGWQGSAQHFSDRGCDYWRRTPFRSGVIEDHGPFVNLQLSRVQPFAMDFRIRDAGYDQADEIRSISNHHVARNRS
jgi:hypothetical protein